MASGHGRPIQQVNIHKQYLAQLPKQKNQKKAEFEPNETAGSGTAPMTYHGGPIQQHPKVYLLLWGPNWSADTNTAYLQNFIAGLGVQPQDDWSTSMSQYTDSSGNHPTFNGSVYAGTFQDTTTPPYGATQTQLGAEADAFYQTHGISDNTNTQIVVATQDGTCPEGFYGCGTGNYCAWHSYSSSYQVPYTNLPYLSGQTGCGAGYVNSPGTNDGVSIVEGHEYGETVTDPRLNAWYDTDLSGENGDKCAWTGLANVNLSTGTFAMQPLWSNSAGGCVMHTSVATSYPLTIARSGTGSGTVTSSPSGINCGTTCSANFTSGTSVTLRATPASGSTFGGWSGACTGTGTCTVSMTAAQNVTATFTSSTGGGTTSQETSLSISYAGWGGVVDASANGGGYRQSNTKGGTAKFKFSGTSVTWLARTGPDRGIASVTIDGVSKGTTDLYSASPSGLSKAFTGLASKTHTIIVKVNGTKNASSTGTYVTVDGFAVGTTTTQESAKGVAYNKWVGASSVNASGGGYRSTTSGSSTFAFTGTGVDWITATGPGWGKAEVYVDNIDKGTVDLYAASAHWQTAKSYSGLSSGAHTLTVKALNTKNASATSTKVPIDAFVVH